MNKDNVIEFKKVIRGNEVDSHIQGVCHTTCHDIADTGARDVEFALKASIY
jgi:hypothetical protein